MSTNHEYYGGEISCSGELVTYILDAVVDLAKPGVTTKYISDRAKYLMDTYHVKSAPIELGFPGAMCISVYNESHPCVCHGVPSDYKLQEGDIVSLDVSVHGPDGYADACRTVLMPGCDRAAASTVIMSRALTAHLVKKIRPRHTYKRMNKEMSHIRWIMSMSNTYILPHIGGHGIGESLHEGIIDYTRDDDDAISKSRFVCHEPLIVKLKDPKVRPKVYLHDDKWSIMCDGITGFAQTENMIDKFGRIIAK